MVPDVLGLVPSTWAEPCVPLAGPTGPPMGVYLVPPIGAGVWVEFEHGDPDYPIWVGLPLGFAVRHPDAGARRAARVAEHRPADGRTEHAS